MVINLQGADSKRVIPKAAEATNDLIAYKVANKITKCSKNFALK